MADFLTKKRKVFRTIKIRSWAADFKSLLAIHSEKKITAALEGYFRHFGKQYMPEAYSARSFCEKFPNIERSIERYEGRMRDEPANVLDGPSEYGEVW